MSLYPKMEVLSERLPSVEALDGDELVFVLDDPAGSPTPKVATTQQIADLGGGGGASSPEHRLRFACTCAYGDGGVSTFSFQFRPGCTVSGDIELTRVVGGNYQLTFSEDIGIFQADILTGLPNRQVVYDTMNGGIMTATVQMDEVDHHILNLEFQSDSIPEAEFNGSLEFDFLGND